MRRATLVVPLLVAAAAAVSGCEQLCPESGIGVFCPESARNPLNEPPLADGEIVMRGITHFSGCEPMVSPGTRVVFSLPSVFDPDGDPLLYEWDLDGDGDFEAGGAEPSRIYTRPGTVRVRVRVSDFPRHLGAPGVLERGARLKVVDPASNRPPRAAFDATAPVIAGHGVAFDAAATTDPDVNDGFVYLWDFGDGTFHPARNISGLDGAVVHVYPRAGTYTVRLSVFDCSGARGDTEQRIVVRPETTLGSAPSARFTATPESPFTGQLVTLDGSSSSGNIVLYEWDFGADFVFDRSSSQPLTTTAFDVAGEHVIRLRVTDDEGRVSAEVGSITVRLNTPPTAAFSVFPVSPFVGWPTTFTSHSSDAEGAIARHEWDRDGDGSFETDTGAVGEFTTSYSTPGERFVRLRVTDSHGLTAITGRTVNVRPPEASASARARAPLAFSLRLSGRPIAGRAPTARGRGQRRSLVGVGGRGSARAQLVAPARRTTAAERRAARFLRSSWRTRVNFAYDRRTRRWSANGIALARAGRASACLRVRLDARPGRYPTGRATLLGGRGAGARLRGGASLRFRFERDGSATVLGGLRVRTGKARPLPRACRAL